MSNIDKVIEAFVNGDYFIIFLILIVIILIVLILALVKSRQDYNELVRLEAIKEERERERKRKLYTYDGSKIEEETEEDEIEPIEETDDLLSDLRSLMASSKEDTIDINKPLNIEEIKTYDSVIDDYENSEEENAIISAEELEKKAKERKDFLGVSENQEVIAKYEEEQEKKAIISYEQLLKNASNITLSYKTEETKEAGAPRVNKIEIEQKEVTPSDNYLAEEEFLKILKELRISL